MTTEHTSSSTWGSTLQRFAAELGIADYRAGLFWFRQYGGPEILIEPIGDSCTVAVHADLGPAPRAGDSECEITVTQLLEANSPRRGAPVCAIDPVNGQLVLFDRFDDAAMGYEAFAQRVNLFAIRVKDGVAALLAPTEEAPEAPEQDPTNEATFRSLWADFMHQRGLSAEDGDAQDDGGLIAMEDGGGVLIALETPTGSVLLKCVMAFMPLDEEEMGEAEADDFLRPLLEAHLLAEATDGACFAIDEEDGPALVLYRRLPLAGLSAFDLSDAVDRIATTAVRFSSMLNLRLPDLQAID